MSVSDCVHAVDRLARALKFFSQILLAQLIEKMGLGQFWRIFETGDKFDILEKLSGEVEKFKKYKITWKKVHLPKIL